MHQIIRGTTATIEFEIFLRGKLVNADGDVTVKVVDADYPETQIGEPAVAFNDPVEGKYTFDLDPVYTSLNRVLQVTWSYELEGHETYQDIFYEVYTPYASISEVIDYYEFSTRPEDLNYRSVQEIINAEAIARKQVEAYTSQTFGRAWGSQEIFGNGSDALELTQRMVSVSKLYQDGVLVLDYTTDPVYNNFGAGVELTPTYKAIRIKGESVTYDNRLDPTILYYGQFRNGSRYLVYGEIGWPYVPTDIKNCTILLAGDYLSQDSKWRNKYLTKINLGETSFEIGKGAFNGTGNVIVDSILDHYRSTGIVII